MADGGSDKSSVRRRTTRRLPPNKRHGRWDLRLQEARARREAALAETSAESSKVTASDQARRSEIALHDERELANARGAAVQPADPFSGAASPTEEHSAAAPEPEDVARARVAAEALGDGRRRWPSLKWTVVAYTVFAAAAAYTVFEAGLLERKPRAPERLAIAPVSGPIPEVLVIRGLPVPGEFAETAPIREVKPAYLAAAPVTEVQPYPPKSVAPAPIERPLPLLNARSPRPSPLNDLPPPLTPPQARVVEMRFVSELYRGRPAMMPFNLNNAIDTTGPPPPLAVIPQLKPLVEVAVTPTLLLPLRPSAPRPRPGIVVPVYPASEAGTWRPVPRPVTERDPANQTDTGSPDVRVEAGAEVDPTPDVIVTTPAEETAVEATEPPITTQLTARIVLFAPRITSDTELEVLGDQMRALGFSDVTGRRHSFGISETQIRYYDASNRIAALSLADTLRGEARDFTDFRPRPEPGLIEIWLPGDAPASDVTNVSSSSVPTTRRPSPIETVERTISRILDDILP